MSTEEGEFIDDEAQKNHLFISQQMFFALQFTQEYSLDSNNFLPFHDLTPLPSSIKTKQTSDEDNRGHLNTTFP